MIGAAVQPGERVRAFVNGADWGPGVVEAVADDGASVRIALGRVSVVVPPADVRRVCGVCPDCRHLNERPACARGVL